MPRELQHGAYFRVHVPPSDETDLVTAQAIWQAQTQHSIPSVSSPATSSWTESQPQSRNEEPHSEDESEDDVTLTEDHADQPEIAEELFEFEDGFFDRIFNEWDDAAITEDEDLGPVAYFSTWYLSDRTMHRCNLPRPIGLLDDHDRWHRRIAELWHDMIDQDSMLYFYLVHPDPPSSITEQHVAGHIILAQHLRPHQRATHMTVIRADLADAPHIAWAMICRHRANKAIIYGWHLVTAVCPPMAPRNKCTCRTGDQEILDGDEIDLHNGQSVYTLVERAHKAVEPLSVREQHLIGTAAARRSPDFAPAPEPTDEGDYPGVIEFTPGATSSGSPVQLCLSQLIPDVPKTCIVRLIQGSAAEHFPPFVEVEHGYSAAALATELAAWGHHCKVFLLQPHDVAFCISEDWQPLPSTWHYLYVNEDASDGQGTFAHTAEETMDELAHMKLLHQCGYNRAAIIACEPQYAQLYLIRFQDVKATIAPRRHRDREATPWPAPQPLQTDFSKVSDLMTSLPPGNDNYVLQFQNKPQDIVALLNSSQGVLCQDITYLELPDEVRQHVAHTPLAQKVGPFDHYDRLVVYTDGSSQAKLRRSIPDRPDDPASGVDSWAFVVLGEVYTPQHSALAMLSS